MIRTYETMVLLDNREVRQGWDSLKNTVAALFTKHGAEMLSTRRWDERRLAYPISHQTRGTYLLCYYKLDTDQIAPVRRELEYADPVLRHLSMACEEVPETAYEPEAEFDESAVRVDDERPAAEPEAPKKSGDSKSGEKAEDGKDGGAKDEAAKDDAPKAEGEAKAESKTEESAKKEDD